MQPANKRSLSVSDCEKGASILIVGVGGRTGVEFLHCLAKHYSRPSVHVLCRDESELSPTDQAWCESIITGDPCCANDIDRALRQSHAEFVVFCTESTDVKCRRAVTAAKCLASVIEMPEYEDIRLIVISRPWWINIGYGMGRVISWYLHESVIDRKGLETAFDTIQDRTLVVRATFLTDKRTTGRLAFFREGERWPSLTTNRFDLAVWITEMICYRAGVIGGLTVNVTRPI